MTEMEEWVRKRLEEGENPDELRISLRESGRDPEIVDKILKEEKSVRAEERSFGKLMAVSFFLPIIGGVYAWRKRREGNPELARMLFLGTFALPLSIFSNFLPGIIGFGNQYMALLALVIPIGLFYISQLDNGYRDLLWAFYLSVPGLIYCYAIAFRGEERIRNSIWHFAIYYIGVSIVLSLFIGLGRTYLRAKMYTPEPEVFQQLSEAREMMNYTNTSP